MGGPQDFTEHVERIFAPLENLRLDPFVPYTQRLRRVSQQFQEFVARLEAHAQSGMASSSRGGNPQGSLEESIATSEPVSSSSSDEEEEEEEEEDQEEGEVVVEEPNEERVSSRGGRRSPLNEAAQLRQAAVHVLKGAIQTMQKLQKVIQDIQKEQQSSRANWFEMEDGEDRIAHLKHVARMQKRRGPAIDEQEKIRLVLACLSLAKDFRSFEEKAGWQSKYSQTVEQLSQMATFKPPKLSNHIPNFTSALAVVEKEHLSQGIRLGTKLLLVENLTNGGLALLLGFECHRVSRLSYKALPELKRIFEQEQDYSFLRHYCKHAAGWLQAQMDPYDYCFSVYSSRQRGNPSVSPAPGSSTPSAMPLPSEITPFRSEHSVSPAPYRGMFDSSSGNLHPQSFMEGVERQQDQSPYRRNSGMSMDYDLGQYPYSTGGDSQHNINAFSSPWSEERQW